MLIKIEQETDIDLMKKLIGYADELNLLEPEYEQPASQSENYRGNNLIITGDAYSQHYQFDLLIDRVREMDNMILTMGYDKWENIAIDPRNPGAWVEKGGFSRVTSDILTAFQALEEARIHNDGTQTVIAIMNAGQILLEYPEGFKEILGLITAHPNLHVFVATGDVDGFNCLDDEIVSYFDNRVIFKTSSPELSTMIIGNDEAAHIEEPDHYCSYYTVSGQILNI